MPNQLCKFVVLCCAVFIVWPALAAAPATAPHKQGAAGTWLGTIKVGAIELRLGLVVEKDAAGKLKASLNSIDQGGVVLPCDQLTVGTDGAVKFAIKVINASYDGKLAADGSAIDGTFTQGAKLPLKFERVTALPTVPGPRSGAPDASYAGARERGWNHVRAAG